MKPADIVKKKDDKTMKMVLDEWLTA